MLIEIINFVNWSILCYFIFLSCGYIVLLITSMPEILLRFKEVKIGNIISLMDSPLLPPVTVIVPAYNESSAILETIESILKNDYLNKSIIIVNPGSTDRMLKKLIDAYALHQVTPLIPQKIKTTCEIRGYYISLTHHNIVLIDTDRDDRSDTLNVGINACRTPLFMTVDADTLMEPDAISRILFYMLSRSNMIAAGGAVFILNGCTFKDGEIISANMSLKPLYAFQTCEYLRSFYFSRVGWNSFGGALCYAGAFTVFNLKSAVRVGGYKVGNLAQDFEIITHLHADFRENHLKYRIGYTPSAAVWTDVPGTYKEYWKQRYNWQYSILQSLMPYKKMLFNPTYGMVGFITYPFFLFGETLSAIVEFLAYLSLIICLYLGILDVYWAVLFFILCWGFSILLTIATSMMAFSTFNRYKKFKNIVWVLFFSIIEIFGFRQYNVICRTSATLAYFLKNALTWLK